MPKLYTKSWTDANGTVRYFKDEDARNGKGDTLDYDETTEMLQLKSGSTVLSQVRMTGGGGGGISIGDVIYPSSSTLGRNISMTWTDPADVELSGVVLAAWEGTKVVRKAGSAPTDRFDGVEVADNKTRNAYSLFPLIDSGLEYGTTYYYRFFTYTDSKKYTAGSVVSETPTRQAITTLPSQSTVPEYTGSVITAEFDNYDIFQLDVTGNTGTNAGTYTATFTPKEGYCWSDGTLTGKDVTWTIAKQEVEFPSVSGNTFTYDGTVKGPTVGAYDSSIMEIDETYPGWKATATDAGEYQLTFTVLDSSNYTFGNDSESGGYVWVINKAQLTVPVQNTPVPTYTGSAITETDFANYDSGKMSVSGNVQTNAGSYTATFSLSDPDNYEWANGTVTDKEVSWSIGKADFTATVTISGYTYAGTKSTPSVSNNPGNGRVTYYGRVTSGGTSTDWGSVTNTTYNAGTRYCYAVVAETANYNSYTTAEASFTIAKADFTASVSIAGYTYKGTKSTPTVTSNPGNGTVTFYGRATASGTATNWSSVTNTTYDAGTRYCYAVIAETTNYNSYTTGNTSFTIAKADFTATVSISGYTYAGTKSTPSVSANPGNGTVTYYGRATSGGSATAWTSVTSTTYNAGTRYCYAVIDATTNYNSCTTAEASFTIAQATGSVSVSTNSVALTTTNTYADVTITKTSDAALTVSSNDTSVATVALQSGSTYRITGAGNGTTKVVASVAATTNYSAASAEISISTTFTRVYGVYWDGTSTTAMSRTDDAQNFTNPSPALNNGTGSSPFDSLMPWSGMVKSTRSDAGTVVAIPKFWYKLTQSGSTLKVQIADGAKDGFSVSPAHMDRGDGKGERDVVYVGRYHCATSTYKSTTGVQPAASATRSAFRTSIHNLGSNVWQMDFATRFTIWLLYIVEFADWNSQAKIGYGCSPSNSKVNMGYTDAMTYHTGTDRSARTTYGGTQYRWIEGLWDNVYDWVDGCYYNGNGLNIIKNPSSFSDSANGTAIGTPTSGYPSALSVKNVSGTFPAFIPSASSGSDSTYLCDYWVFGSSWPCLYAGGDYSQNSSHGLFYVCYAAASFSGGNIGARLLVLP